MIGALTEKLARSQTTFVFLGLSQSAQTRGKESRRDFSRRRRRFEKKNSQILPRTRNDTETSGNAEVRCFRRIFTRNRPQN